MLIGRWILRPASAYGRIGDVDIGGIEIIGYDPAKGTYGSHCFDSRGNVSLDDLTQQDGMWRWQGERTRAEAVFLDQLGAFAKALEHLKECKATTTPGRVQWLLTILKTTVIDELRKCNRRKLIPLVDDFLSRSSVRLETVLEDKLPPPDKQVEQGEWLRILLRVVPEALDQLPEDQRDVVIMRDQLRLKVGEIADALGRTEKSVAGLLRRAREELRRLLERYR